MPEEMKGGLQGLPGLWEDLSWSQGRCCQGTELACRAGLTPLWGLGEKGFAGLG